MLTALHLMNSYTRSNIVNIMVFHFAKVDVLSGLFSGMLSNVLRLSSLNNDQGVTSTSTRFTYFIVSKGLLFVYIRFSFFVNLSFKTDLDSMNLIFKTRG